MARHLLAVGAPVDPQDRFGRTPLWVALFNARDGDGEVVRVLLVAGADAGLENFSEISPRSLAETITTFDLMRFFGRERRSPGGDRPRFRPRHFRTFTASVSRHNAGVSEHVTEYCVDRDLLDPRESEFACQAVLRVVLARVDTAWIDAYSDEDDLPEAAREAQKELCRMGRARESGDPGMAIDLDISQSDHVRLLRTFASWSIGVELYDSSMQWVAYIADTGSSMCFNVTDEEAAAIRADLGELPIITVSDLNARRKL